MLLYKYLKFERNDLFETGLIRFTQPKYFNDPFEALPFVENILSPELASGIIQVLSDRNQVEIITKGLNNQDTKNTFKELYSTFHRSSYTKQEEIKKRLLGNSKEDLSQVMQSFWSDQIGILSLSEENDNLTMWSHYANSHEGFVIGFNPNKNITDIKTQFIRLKKIHYSYKRPNLSLFELEQNTSARNKQWLKAFLLTKSKDWAYENEWRQVNMLRYASNTINSNFGLVYLFNYNVESIDSVFLGYNMPLENRRKIITMIKNLNIKIYEMRINKNNYALDKVRIN